MVESNGTVAMDGAGAVGGTGKDVIMFRICGMLRAELEEVVRVIIQCPVQGLLKRDYLPLNLFRVRKKFIVSIWKYTFIEDYIP